MVPRHSPIRPEQLAELHGDDGACPGPWRGRRKLPPLLAASHHEGLDRAVVKTLLGHGELLGDLARLCADALRHTGGSELDPALVKKLTDAFLKLDPANPEHKEILALQRASKFVPTKASNYDGIEQAAKSAGLIK